MISMKTCTKCKLCQPVIEFNDSRYSKDGKTQQCKACKPAKPRKKSKPNKQQLLKGTLKHKFGLTLKDYDQMLLSQGSICAICHRPETSRGVNGSIKRLSVDHNHKTGRVRGLLCTKCNTMLGYAQDNPDILAEAAAYLVNTDGYDDWEPPEDSGWRKFGEVYVWGPNTRTEQETER